MCVLNLNHTEYMYKQFTVLWSKTFSHICDSVRFGRACIHSNLINPFIIVGLAILQVFNLHNSAKIRPPQPFLIWQRSFPPLFQVKNKKRWSQVMYMSYVLDFLLPQDVKGMFTHCISVVFIFYKNNYPIHVCFQYVWRLLCTAQFYCCEPQLIMIEHTFDQMTYVTRSCVELTTPWLENHHSFVSWYRAIGILIVLM